MRVLLSVAEMATGGAERIVVELTRALRADGDEVAVAADSGPFDRLLEGSGAERYPLPGRGRSPLTAARAVLRVRSATRRFRPAVIHAHNVRRPEWLPPLAWGRGGAGSRWRRPSTACGPRATGGA